MNNTEMEIFKNQDDASTLIKNSVVKIPFLNSDELKELKEFYHNYHQGTPPPTIHNGMHMTIWHSDYTYKTNIKKGIKNIIAPAFERNFINYKNIGHQFIVKNQGKHTAFDIHQDWSIVDEETHFSMNVWIPLTDVDENNGAMWIVNGSHKIGNKVRGAGILFPNYYQHLESLKPYITSYPMKAGEALIFYHSAIHGSPMNQNSEPRIVIQSSLMHQETPLQVYFKKNERSPLEIHHTDDEIGMNYKDIRKESAVIPPTPKPSKIIQNFEMESIHIDKLLQFLKNSNSHTVEI